MEWYNNPQPFRLRQLRVNHAAESPLTSMAGAEDTPMLMNLTGAALDLLRKNQPHSQHPDFPHLILLVFEAVLEVCVVAAPGYILARHGAFTAQDQSFLSKINIAVFTPCLIFNKLASQLSAEKLVDLAVIPFIFVVQTIVSWGCAAIVSRLFKLRKTPRNFVTAMAVFGNSNSLPISLVISLSKTLSGLHWDKIPGDNDNEVAARGILYLLIFQQLGQMLRWSWGYNVLLAPPKKESASSAGSYRDEESEDEEERLIDYDTEDDDRREDSLEQIKANGSDTVQRGTTSSVSNSGTLTPGESPNGDIRGAALGTDPTPDSGLGPHFNDRTKPTNGDSSYNHHYSRQNTVEEEAGSVLDKPMGILQRIKSWMGRSWNNTKASIKSGLYRAYASLPQPLRKALSSTFNGISKVVNKFLDVMNPPLWAMLSAVIVASVPALQELFYKKGTFINNSVSHAIGQSGGVAVPLILFVLGGNLARNTIPKGDQQAIDTDDPKEERSVLIASLVSRMLLPTIIMAPIIAVIAKYVPVSILDDPIFVIVCFLLTGAPSALQLAQICQVNGVYMGAMSKLLFQSYVVWILPSTLVLVMLALETVEWATGQ